MSDESLRRLGDRLEWAFPLADDAALADVIASLLLVDAAAGEDAAAGSDVAGDGFGTAGDGSGSASR